MGRGSLRRSGLDAKGRTSQHQVMVAFAPSVEQRCLKGDPKLLKQAVDRRLRALLSGSGRSDELSTALHYSLLAPGKRIRPILTVLSSWEFGEQDLRALDAGCAIEMVHTASLILDDLPAMDDSRERRGQAATHIRFGEDVAMLSAITLLSKAYATLSGMEHVSADTRCTLIGILARAVGQDGLAGGQFTDLRPAAISGPHAAAEANHRKTGALFVAAIEMATAIRGVDHDEAQALHRCARELGQAYQLLDDITDAALPGRPLRSEDVGKATVLSFVGLEAAQHRLRHHLDTALAGLHSSSALAGYVRALFGTEHAVTEMV